MEDDMQKRYLATYLSWDLAKKRIAAMGADPETASIWDHCEECDIEVGRKFSTKAAAVAWAKKNVDRDIFGMPRIQEDTYGPVTDDLANPAGFDWERTGYWEIDGTEIEEIAA
jgi:hypothetical protein